MYSMQKIREARALIRNHEPLLDVSKKVGIPPATLRKYTKAERAKVKEEQKNGIYK